MKGDQMHTNFSRKSNEIVIAHCVTDILQCQLYQYKKTS